MAEEQSDRDAIMHKLIVDTGRNCREYLNDEGRINEYHCGGFGPTPDVCYCGKLTVKEAFPRGKPSGEWAISRPAASPDGTE